MPSNKIKKKSPSAAVMVLHEYSTDSLILTKRSRYLRHHPGEICFPGGIQEIQDEHLYATALRELHEELGVSAARVHLIKELLREKTLLGTVIYPWFASIESIHPLNINSAEVSAVIRIPMQRVKVSENYREITVDRLGQQIKSCEFMHDEEWIWGATARIMKQLCS